MDGETGRKVHSYSIMTVNAVGATSEVWQMLLSEDMSPKEIGSGDRRAIYPVNVQQTLFVSSLSEKRIQLCDVVAGAVATWGRGVIGGETSEYLDILREVDVGPLVKAMIWPDPEVDPDKLGTN
jgi:hypothetical protein